LSNYFQPKSVLAVDKTALNNVRAASQLIPDRVSTKRYNVLTLKGRLLFYPEAGRRNFFRIYIYTATHSRSQFNQFSQQYLLNHRGIVVSFRGWRAVSVMSSKNGYFESEFLVVLLSTYKKD